MHISKKVQATFLQVCAHYKVHEESNWEVGKVRHSNNIWVSVQLSHRFKSPTKESTLLGIIQVRLMVDLVGGLNHLVILKQIDNSKAAVAKLSRDPPLRHRRSYANQGGNLFLKIEELGPRVRLFDLVLLFAD